MIFVTVPTREAIGGILAHSLRLGARRWPKGRHLDGADIAAADAAGIASLTIARLGANDVGEDAAAARLAGCLAGAAIVALPAAHGRANLAARSGGLVSFDPAMVAAVNAQDEALTLATLAPDSRVAAGDLVATVKVIRYAVDGDCLAAACAAARPLVLSNFRPQTVALLATMLPGLDDKVVAKTARVTRSRIESLGCTMVEMPPCAHDATRLAHQLRSVAADIILVIGASATVDRGDVIPAAIELAGGSIIRLGMPVDPGNLLCLGEIGGRHVIGLPGCARSPRRNGFDLVLERLVAGRTVTSADIAAMGSGGLLPKSERPLARAPRRMRAVAA